MHLRYNTRDFASLVMKAFGEDVDDTPNGGDDRIHQTFANPPALILVPISISPALFV